MMLSRGLSLLLGCLLAHTLLHVPNCSCWHVPWSLRRPGRRWIELCDELAADPARRDDHFMQIALHEARRAFACHEVPIGSVVVQTRAEEGGGHLPHSYRILGRAHNHVERRKDASAHAELLALRRAGRALGNWRLSTPRDTSNIIITTTLYSTCEPCLTCWSACHAFRVQRLVYGADDLRLGARTAFNMPAPCCPHDDPRETSKVLATHPFHNLSEIKERVRQQECGDLLRDFFRRRRRKPTRRSGSRTSRLLSWFRSPLYEPQRM